MTAARHPAGQATYDGNVEHIVGELKGKTTYGAVVIATDGTYDAETDLTVVTFAHATPADLDAVYTLDVHGTLGVEL